MFGGRVMKIYVNGQTYLQLKSKMDGIIRTKKRKRLPHKKIGLEITNIVKKRF